MKLEDIQEEWKKDSDIKLDDPDRAETDTLSGGKLHSKYMNIVSTYTRALNALERKIVTHQFWLEGYYKDGLYCEELGRDRKSPKIAKTNEEAKRMVNADPVMEKMLRNKDEITAILLFCKEVVEYIRWNRTRDIQNHIEIKKWYNGQL